MIYKLRVILDANEDIFRDIEIKANQSLGKLHEGIKSAFSLPGEEMASFYYADEDWNQLEEIPMEDMTDDGSGETMYDLNVKNVFLSPTDRMLYVYDFLHMWTFYVELQEILDVKPTANYPRTKFRFGKMPLKVPSKKASNIDSLMNFEEESDDIFDQDLMEEGLPDNIDENFEDDF